MVTFAHDEPKPVKVQLVVKAYGLRMKIITILVVLVTVWDGTCICTRRMVADDERERRRGGDDVDELAEERLLLVLGVVLLRELAVDLDQLARAQREAAALDARKVSPARRRCTASGLIRMSDRSTATGVGT
jgi:hypothetical protein